MIFCITFSELLFCVFSAFLLLVIIMFCMLCGKILELKETLLCNSCFDFIEWKYSSIENFLDIRNMCLKARGYKKCKKR